MNTHTSYFTFSVAEVVQAVGKGVGRKEKGGQGSSQGFGPVEARKELLTAERRSCGKRGGLPLFGATPLKKV